jgi:hypothetical protein
MNLVEGKDKDGRALAAPDRSLSSLLAPRMGWRRALHLRGV